MKTIATIDGIRICKFQDETNSIHVVDGRFYGVINLITYKIIRGQLPDATYKKVILWLEINDHNSK